MNQPTIDPQDIKEHVARLKEAYNVVRRYKDWDCNQDPIDEELAYCRSSQMWEDVEEGDGALTLEQFKLAKEYSDYWMYEPDYDYDFFEDDGKDYA